MLLINAMSEARNCLVINTVQFRFPPGSPRPSWDEIASFIKQLDTSVALMETAYKTAHDRSLFIKFSSLDAMEEAMKKNADPIPFTYSSGKSVHVRMSIAGTDFRYVRVFDLPPELNDECLSAVLGEFGNVDRIIREKFPADSGLSHMCTGVRGVHMEVKKAIPPSLQIAEWKANVFYDGLKDTCFQCHSIGHRRESCPMRQDMNKRDKKKQQNPVSYAGIVAGSGVSTVERTSSDEVIEVLEESFSQPSDTDEAIQNQPAVLEKQNLPNSEKENLQKKSTPTLKDVALAIQEAILNPTAKQRRTQFASSGSGSGSVPRVKCARKMYY